MCLQYIFDPITIILNDYELFKNIIIILLIISFLIYLERAFWEIQAHTVCFLFW